MNISHDVANARFEVPGYELVYSAPLETQLQNDDLRDSAEVWRQMFAQARQRIDIAQFYVMNRAGSRLDAVLAELRRAGERGVQIRLLLERKGLRNSAADTLEQLATIPQLELRVLDYQQLSGGIMHAKYLLVDGEQAFVGSQNFDWRALEHIHGWRRRAAAPSRRPAAWWRAARCCARNSVHRRKSRCFFSRCRLLVKWRARRGGCQRNQQQRQQRAA